MWVSSAEEGRCDSPDPILMGFYGIRGTGPAWQPRLGSRGARPPPHLLRRILPLLPPPSRAQDGDVIFFKFNVTAPAKKK